MKTLLALIFSLGVFSFALEAHAASTFTDEIWNQPNWGTASTTFNASDGYYWHSAVKWVVPNDSATVCNAYVRIAPLSSPGVTTTVRVVYKGSDPDMGTLLETHAVTNLANGEYLVDFDTCYTLQVNEWFWLDFGAPSSRVPVGKGWYLGGSSVTSTASLWQYTADSGLWHQQDKNPYLRINGTTNPVYTSTLDPLLASTTNLGFYLGATGTSITASCPDLGMIITPLCDGILWLFMPNLTSLSSSISSTKSLLSSRFPFSYLASFQSALTAAESATNTQDITVQMNFSTIAGTTGTSFGAFLPNVTMVSPTTVQQYIPAGTWTFLKLLLSFAVYVATGELIYFGVLRLFNPHEPNHV